MNYLETAKKPAAYTQRGNFVSVRLHKEYKTQQLKELRDRLRCDSSVRQRSEIRRRAIQLFWKINKITGCTYIQKQGNEKQFRYEAVMQQIQGVLDTPLIDDETIAQSELRPELAKFIEDLSIMDPTPMDSIIKPVYTMNELQQKFGLADKVRRGWRNKGLLFLTCYLVEGEVVMGLAESDLLQFCNNNPELLEDMSDHFYRLPEKMRLQLIADFRSRIERSLTKNGNDDDASASPKNEVIADVPDQQSEASRRYERIQKLPLEFMASEEFIDEKKRDGILAPPPEADTLQIDYGRMPPDKSPIVARAYAYPLFTPQQEKHMFRQYNYCKYLAWTLRAGLDPATPNEEILNEIEALYQKALEVRSWLIGCNLRLPVSIAKKYVISCDYDELLEDASHTLFRAVEKFDYGRGYKFSSYCVYAIKKQLHRFLNNRRNNRFTQIEDVRHGSENQDFTEDGFSFNNIPDTSTYEDEEEQTLNDYRHIVHEVLLPSLPPREHYIFSKYHNLQGGDNGSDNTFDLAEQLGISHQCVSNILHRATKRLKRIIEQKSITFPEDE